MSNLSKAIILQNAREGVRNPAQHVTVTAGRSRRTVRDGARSRFFFLYKSAGKVARQ